MSGRLFRAQILLEPEQHRQLADLARRQGKSISEVVREVLAAHLEEQRKARLAAQLAALDRIEQHRNEILARRGGKPLDIDWVELINRMREEQDDHTLGLDRDRD